MLLLNYLKERKKYENYEASKDEKNSENSPKEERINQSLASLNNSATEKPQDHEINDLCNQENPSNCDYINDLNVENDENNLANDINPSKRNDSISNEIEELTNKIENDLSIYHQNRANLFNLNDREEYIRKNFNLEYFFKSNPKLYESAVLLKNASLEELFFDIGNESVLYILVIVRDKVIKAYNEILMPVEIEGNVSVSNNQASNEELKVDQVWPLLRDYLKSSASYYMPYMNELPGFEDISQTDLNLLISHNLPVFLRFKFGRLFVNDELHLVLNNIRINRGWLNQFFGEIICNYFFEFVELVDSLNLTNYETALLVPYLLTITGI